MLRGLIVKQPYASKIVRGEMPVIFLPGRAKGRFIEELVKRKKKIVILSALSPAEPINESDYPLGKAVGTVKVYNVLTATKEEILSGSIKEIEKKYAQEYPWKSCKLNGKISIWFLKEPEEWNPALSYQRMPGAQRWIKNVKIKPSDT